MRRFWLLSLAFLMIGLASGCKCPFSSHGICDCEYDDYCATKQPWVAGHQGGAGGCAGGGCGQAR